MAHPLKHAESSAKKFGGKAEDYLAIHNWFDESKAFLADFRHRGLRHHAEGIFLCERIFGIAITNSEGRQVPVRYIGEQHVRRTGRIPTAQDWLSQIAPSVGCMANDSRDTASNNLARQLLVQPVSPSYQPILCGSLLALCWFPKLRKTEVLVNPCISAVQHLRPLRGGAQSHLLQGI